MKQVADYRELLNKFGLATLEFNKNAALRDETIRVQISAIAQDASINVDLANAITEARSFSHLQKGQARGHLIDFRHDDAFFQQIAQQISIVLSYTLGDYLQEERDRLPNDYDIVRKEVPIAYLDAFKTVFSSVDTTHIPLPELSARSFREWAETRGDWVPLLDKIRRRERELDDNDRSSGHTAPNVAKAILKRATTPSSATEIKAPLLQAPDMEPLQGMPELEFKEPIIPLFSTGNSTGEPVLKPKPD